ncbi:hypothetical protein HDU92_007692 [Lobulomyces angularis]|nr:hypothetical protein HDU92_007692 [Lobulomyces angularis]
MKKELDATTVFWNHLNYFNIPDLRKTEEIFKKDFILQDINFEQEILISEELKKNCFVDGYKIDLENLKNLLKKEQVKKYEEDKILEEKKEILSKKKIIKNIKKNKIFDESLVTTDVKREKFFFLKKEFTSVLNLIKLNFKEIKLVQQKIVNFEKEEHELFFKGFTNLLNLSLTGNYLDQFEQSNLNAEIKYLHLNCNKFKECPNFNELKSLLHLGLSYNLIESIEKKKESIEELAITTTINIYKTENRTKTKVNQQPLPSIIQPIRCSMFPENLKSLDLSFNNLTNLVSTVDVLKPFKNLKILNLKGNPFCLIKNYKKFCLKNLIFLNYFDDFKIAITTVKKDVNTLTTEGENNVVDEISTSEGIPDEVESDDEISLGEEVQIQLQVKDIKDLPIPPTILQEDITLPPDEYKFGVIFTFLGYNNYEVSTPLLRYCNLIDFNFNAIERFPVSKEFRDSLKVYFDLDGINVKLKRYKISYQPKEKPLDQEQAVDVQQDLSINKDKLKSKLNQSKAQLGQSKVSLSSPSAMNLTKKYKKNNGFNVEELELNFDPKFKEEVLIWEYLFESEVFLNTDDNEFFKEFEITFPESETATLPSPDLGIKLN